MADPPKRVKNISLLKVWYTSSVLFFNCLCDFVILHGDLLMHIRTYLVFGVAGFDLPVKPHISTSPCPGPRLVLRCIALWQKQQKSQDILWEVRAG